MRTRRPEPSGAARGQPSAFIRALIPCPLCKGFTMLVLISVVCCLAGYAISRPVVRILNL